MRYTEFDKDLTPTQIRQLIIDLLTEAPRIRKEIYETINAKNTKIDTQMIRLIRDKLIDKKFYNNVWFYGLTLAHRQSINEMGEKD